MRCPYCHKLVNFTSENPHFDSTRATTSITARCSACRDTVRLWLVDQGSSESRVYVFPAPPIGRRASEPGYNLPEGVRKAYEEAVGSFNGGRWIATAAMSRRTLEAIVKSLLPDEKGLLAERLKTLNDRIDLAEPLITLSYSVKEGGNLGSHFDEDGKEPDPDTAAAMLDLVENMMWYVYGLPQSLEVFDHKIEQLGKEDQNAD